MAKCINTRTNLWTVYGFVEVKIQLVIRQFIPMILLLVLISIFLPGSVVGQCPDNAVTEDSGQNNSPVKEIYVYDSFNSGIDVSGFEINIFNELTGTYLITESDNFPSIGVSENIEINKLENRIQLINVPAELDLSRCILIIIGGDCPIQKIAITNR